MARNCVWTQHATHYDSDGNFTFHIYFSALLEIVALLQQTCAEASLFRLTAEETEERNPVSEGALGDILVH